MITHQEHRRYEAEVARIIQQARQRSAQLRKLAQHGVRREIVSGCGAVRVNHRGVLLDIELNLGNARAVGEARLSRLLTDAIQQAEAQARRVAELIGSQQ